MDPALVSMLYTVVGGAIGGVLAWAGIMVGEWIMDRKR